MLVVRITIAKIYKIVRHNNYFPEGKLLLYLGDVSLMKIQSYVP